jgi:hypothetical protein
VVKYVFQTVPVFAARIKTPGVMDIRKTAKFNPPAYPSQSFCEYMMYELAIPYMNHAGFARAAAEGPNVTGIKRPRDWAMRVRDPCRLVIGPLGLLWSYPVHDQAIRVLGSERRECRLKIKLPKEIADGIQVLLVDELSDDFNVFRLDAESS